MKTFHLFWIRLHRLSLRKRLSLRGRSFHHILLLSTDTTIFLPTTNVNVKYSERTRCCQYWVQPHYSGLTNPSWDLEAETMVQVWLLEVDKTNVLRMVQVGETTGEAPTQQRLCSCFPRWNVNGSIKGESKTAREPDPALSVSASHSFTYFICL